MTLDLCRTGTSVSGMCTRVSLPPGTVISWSADADDREYSRDYWARNVSPNKDVKVYIGAPGATGAAGGGYVPIDTLSSVAVKMRQSYPSFGGVMLWDASQAYGESVCPLTHGMAGVSPPCPSQPLWRRRS